jgi:tripartite-type tricarboxylate transporter receptor subunit TctC
MMGYRKSGILAGLAIGALLVLSAPTAAQSGAAQDLKFICAFPPGTGADLLVRYFAEKIRPLAGRTIIVENKVGAGGAIALEYVARAKADGNTVLVSAGNNVAATMSLFKKPSVDVLKDIQIAATISRQPYMMVVDSTSPVKSLRELTATLKQKGENGTYGTTPPVAVVIGELYKRATGLNPVQVNYKAAAEMLNDLRSSRLDFAIWEPVFSLTQHRNGRVRIVGITTAERLEAAPDLATMKEQGADVDVPGWWAAMVPTGTPDATVQQLNAWFSEVAKRPETKTFLADRFGADPLVETADKGQARLAASVKDWAEFISVAKIEPQ